MVGVLSYLVLDQLLERLESKVTYVGDQSFLHDGPTVKTEHQGSCEFSQLTLLQESCHMSLLGEEWAVCSAPLGDGNRKPGICSFLPPAQ